MSFQTEIRYGQSIHWHAEIDVERIGHAHRSGNCHCRLHCRFANKKVEMLWIAVRRNINRGSVILAGKRRRPMPARLPLVGNRWLVAAQIMEYVGTLVIGNGVRFAGSQTQRPLPERTDLALLGIAYLECPVAVDLGIR